MARSILRELLGGPGGDRYVAAGERVVDARTALDAQIESKTILGATSYFASSGATAGSLTLGMGGANRPWDFGRSVKEGYSRVVWVYKAVETIASKQAGRRFRIAEVGSDGKPTGVYLTEHDLVPLLNRGQRRPNPRETSRMFRKRGSMQALLSPRGTFTEIVASNADGIAGLDLLPPNRTRVVPATDGSIERFELDPVRPGDPVRRLNPDKVIWVREPHPSDPWAGMTPLEAAGLSVEMDHFARAFNRTLMANDGRPGGIVGVKSADGQAQPTNEAELDRVERKFTEGAGVEGAGRIVVLDGTVTYTDFGAGRDGSYAATREAARDEILTALGVPLSQIGVAAGSTFANAGFEGEGYYLNTQMPHDEMSSGHGSGAAGGAPRQPAVAP